MYSQFDVFFFVSRNLIPAAMEVREKTTQEVNVRVAVRVG